MTTTDIDRFRALVAETNECLMWQGYIDAHGYGWFTVNGAQFRAHRVSYEMWNGPIPEGMVIHHTCRCRSCVNPCHLQALTVSDHSRLHNPPLLVLGGTCPKGHTLTIEVAYVGTAGVDCRICERARNQARQRPVDPPAVRSHCKHGHPLDEANTLISGGKRNCRTCIRERKARQRAAARIHVAA